MGLNIRKDNAAPDFESINLVIPLSIIIRNKMFKILFLDTFTIIYLKKTSKS